MDEKSDEKRLNFDLKKQTIHGSKYPLLCIKKLILWDFNAIKRAARV